MKQPQLHDQLWPVATSCIYFQPSTSKAFLTQSAMCQPPDMAIWCDSTKFRTKFKMDITTSLADQPKEARLKKRDKW